jgi:hypothetical protein
LRSLLMHGSEPVLLLGAGASITSGIPAAGKTVERVARWAWCKENGRHPGDMSIRRSDYWPWLAAQPWYKPNVAHGDLYPEAIDNLLGVKSDRREFLEQLINPPDVPPSRGYVGLTQVHLWALDLFRVTAARTRVFNACSSIFWPSWKSMARRVFPSRLELKRRAGSFRAAPLAKVIFTMFL